MQLLLLFRTTSTSAGCGGVNKTQCLETWSAKQDQSKFPEGYLDWWTHEEGWRTHWNIVTIKLIWGRWYLPWNTNHSAIKQFATLFCPIIALKGEISLRVFLYRLFSFWQSFSTCRIQAFFFFFFLNKLDK